LLVEHADEAGIAALVRALRPSLLVGGREEDMSRASMNARSSRSMWSRTVFSTRRSAIRRVSKRSWSPLLRLWYMPVIFARGLVE
jgi:hypothetical protein